MAKIQPAQVDIDAAMRAIPPAVIFADEAEHVADLRERAAKIFLAHRLNALEEAAKAAEDTVAKDHALGLDVAASSRARNIATAIRALGDRP